MLVEIDADQLHVPALCVTNQIAGAAYVEIAGADGKAGAEPVQRLQRAQPLASGFRQRDTRLRRQQDVTTPVTAPHPPA